MIAFEGFNSITMRVVDCMDIVNLEDYLLKYVKG
jgi:hypothetical protein